MAAGRRAGKGRGREKERGRKGGGRWRSRVAAVMASRSRAEAEAGARPAGRALPCGVLQPRRVAARSSPGPLEACTVLCFSAASPRPLPVSSCGCWASPGALQRLRSHGASRCCPLPWAGVAPPERAAPSASVLGGAPKVPGTSVQEKQQGRSRASGGASSVFSAHSRCAPRWVVLSDALWFGGLGFA